MDHADKIQIIGQLDFLSLIESYRMTRLTIEIDNVDDEEDKSEEEFFHIMSTSLNKLGIWCLELSGNVNNILNDPTLAATFEQIYERIMSRALDLLNTNRPRIANPLLDFFNKYMTSIRKINQLEETDPLFVKILSLIEITISKYPYPEWFIELEGHMPNPSDWSDGRIDD